jgi:hypothetical protein
MKLISMLLVAVSVLGVSCERHEFDGPDGTRQLHEHQASHGDAAHHDEKSPGH